MAAMCGLAVPRASSACRKKGGTGITSTGSRSPVAGPRVFPAWARRVAEGSAQTLVQAFASRVACPSCPAGDPAFARGSERHVQLP